MGTKKAVACNNLHQSLTSAKGAVWLKELSTGVNQQVKNSLSTSRSTVKCIASQHFIDYACPQVWPSPKKAYTASRHSKEMR
eukprot:1151193-Pelagomonas_calceolata.AAC.1